jgi:hypothetical protein
MLSSFKKYLNKHIMNKVQDSGLVIATLLAVFYVEVENLLTSGKHLYDRIISSRVEV